MKLRFFSFVTVAVSALFFQFCLAVPAGCAEYRITEHILKNGLKVLVLEKHTMPVVAVQVWYRVGSHHEWVGIRGMAHLIEHMMFRGSENYGPEEHSRLINEVGGTDNAFTSEDMTVYHERLPSKELELALKLEAERMHLLKINQEILNTELEIVKEEYRVNYENDPVGEVYMKAQKILYPNHPYNWIALGVMSDLDSITVEDCRNFYDLFYAPNNAVLVVVGDVMAEDVIYLAEQYFGNIPPSEIPPEPDLTLPPKQEIKRFKEKLNLPVPLTAVIFYIPESRHQDIIPLQVLSDILTKGDSSRLVKSLTKDKELAVETLGLTFIFQGPGLLVCAGIHLPNISSKRIERTILEEINKLKTEEVTDQEVQKAQKQFLADKIFERYSAHSLANNIGFAEVVKGDYSLFHRELEEFRKVTKADILRVANKYFTEENATIIYFQPKKKSLLVWLYSLFKLLF